MCQSSYYGKFSFVETPLILWTEVADIYNKAVEEAKKWFQDKKVGSSSVAELARGTSNLASTGLEQVSTLITTISTVVYFCY